jgi:hypothetical protein
MLSHHRLFVYIPCLRVCLSTSYHSQSLNPPSCACRIPKKDFEDSFTRTEFKALRLSTKRTHSQLAPPTAIRCEIVLEASPRHGTLSDLRETLIRYAKVQPRPRKHNCHALGRKPTTSILFGTRADITIRFALIFDAIATRCWRTDVNFIVDGCSLRISVC